MTRLITSLAFASFMIFASAGRLAAQGSDGLLSRSELELRVQRAQQHHELIKRAAAAQARTAEHGALQHRGVGPVAVGVPELDPRTAASALALLIGGALVLTATRRRTLV